MVLRVYGTLFTATNAVITMTDIYDTRDYTIFRLITVDIFFPVRDFLEALFFAYLFFYQSKVKLCPKSLSKLNSQYFENMSLPAGVNNQESLRSTAERQETTPKETQFRKFLKGCGEQEMNVS